MLAFKPGLDSVAEKKTLIGQTQQQQASHQQDLKKIDDKFQTILGETLLFLDGGRTNPAKDC
ncbi:MAG: hypothetical protein H0A75_01060 [Candidatus Methanofishera endochildressiae]|uniref:Uncharacterized protein n=1 Tax=Candidatus Methanofishera endochildressiae TaxID=2738884 RepID=A0A7Z0MN77_9GAMM|nr:hypothetical protein [Candidatus Methanofishera endochildressiae]